MTKVIKYSSLLVFVFAFMSISAQDSLTANSVIGDSSETGNIVIKKPKKAALLSTIIPGAGQFYNEKYWKIPIIYAGLATATYFIIDNRAQYKLFQEYYVLDTNSADGQVSPLFDFSRDSEQYRRGISEEWKATSNQYRTWMEYSYIAFIAVYALQILDATVDAHLFSFDVTDDLSLQMIPTMNYTAHREPITGLKLSLHF